MNPFGEMRSTTKHLRTPLKINNNGDQTFINQRSTSYNTPYKFSGKEKDDETSYSYFGARYYHSDISIWLSVDPMSDKFPSTSAYMFVLGNPLRIIDYNGMDTIIVNRMGRFSKPIPAEGDHVFVRGNNKERRTQKIDYDENGKLRDRHKTISVDRNSIVIERNKRRGGGKNTEITLSGESGVEKGQELFEFFANNTIVEWNYNAFLDRENQYKPEALLYTSHLRESVNESYKLDIVLTNPSRYILISDIHSHPNSWTGVQYPDPSPSDINSRDAIQQKLGFPNTIFQLYMPGKNNSSGKYIGY